MPFSSAELQNAMRVESQTRSTFPRESADRILRHGGYIGSVIEHVDSAERLMDLAKEQILACEKKGVSYPSGTVYFADQLHSSKGRFQRSWYAPKGGVWLTLVLVNTLLPESSCLLSLAAGAACCETVRSFDIPASVKWVNDIHVQGKKIAGILAETFTGPVYGEEYILIGIGLNVNNQDFPAQLQATAGSMAMYRQANLDLDAVRQQMLVKLAWNIGLLHYEEDNKLCSGGVEHAMADCHPLISSWRSLSDTIGKNVHFGYNVIEKVQYTARVVDIDTLGRLLMKLPDGTTIVENSGEIIYVRN